MLARPLIGHAGLKAYNAFTHASFSDYSFFVDDIIQEGTVVCFLAQCFCDNYSYYCCKLQLQCVSIHHHHHRHHHHHHRHQGCGALPIFWNKHRRIRRISCHRYFNCSHHHNNNNNTDKATTHTHTPSPLLSLADISIHPLLLSSSSSSLFKL